MKKMFLKQKKKRINIHKKKKEEFYKRSKETKGNKEQINNLIKNQNEEHEKKNQRNERGKKDNSNYELVPYSNINTHCDSD